MKSFKNQILVKLGAVSIVLTASLWCAEAMAISSSELQPGSIVYHVNNSDNSVLHLSYSQNKIREYRSEGEVIREVKRRYNAQVLRVSLDRRSEIYQVRILMPSGKIRHIRVNARR